MRYTHGENAPVHERRRDRGTTFVEILVSIVLLGTAVGGTLTALRTTIVSSERDAGVTKASVWLRGAEDALHRAPYEQCSVKTPAQIKDAYRTAIQLVDASGRVGDRSHDRHRLGPVLGTQRRVTSKDGSPSAPVTTSPNSSTSTCSARPATSGDTFR